MIRILVLLILFCFSAHAGDKGDPVSVIAMHGETSLHTSFSSLPYANPHATQGGALTQCAIGTFDTLNDNTMKGKPAQGLHLINDPLMRRVWNEPFTLYGVIAEKVLLPQDRSSITFFLNPRAIFHDGTSILSSDIEFSFNTLKEKGKSNTRNIYKLVEKVTIIDDRTIRFDFSKGHDRETAFILAMMPVYSKNHWQDRDFDATTLSIPMGSGPYKIKSIDEGKSITYEKVIDYWARKNPVHIGHYNFDFLTFDYYRDSHIATEAFKSGECDIFRERNPAKWAITYRADNGYVMDEILHSRPAPTRGFIFNTRRAPLHDMRVRESLSLAFNFNWVNHSLLHNKTKQIDSIFANSPLAADIKSEKTTKRDRLKKASQLLDKAGWHLKDGHRFELSLILNNPTEEKIALAYARDLKRLGITLNIRTLDTAQFFGALTEYGYDMVSWRWINTLSPGTEQAIYWGCDAAKINGSRNYSGICHDDIEKAITSLSHSKTYTDLTAAAKILDQTIMARHLFIPLYYTGVDYIARWPYIHHTDTKNLYGAVLETWWRDENNAN